MGEVLTMQMQPDNSSLFAQSPLTRSSPSQTSLYIGSPQPYSPRKPQYPPPHSEEPLYHNLPETSSSSSSSSQIDLTQSSSFASDLTGALSIDTSIDADDSLSYPSYNPTSYFDPEDLEPPPSPRTINSYSVPSPTASDSTPNNTPDGPITAGDDTTIQQEPSRHVDYLSHEWKEEDVWSSWRHIVSKRRIYGELSGAEDSKWPRLENASWRTWAKQKYRLSTVSPDTLNWYACPRRYGSLSGVLILPPTGSRTVMSRGCTGPCRRLTAIRCRRKRPNRLADSRRLILFSTRSQS